MSIERDLFEIVLDVKTGSVVSGGRVVKGVLSEIDRDVQKVKRSASGMFDGFGSGVNSFKSAAGSVAGALGVVASGVLAVGGAVVAASAHAIQKAGEFEKLTLSLEAVDGGADKAEKSLKRLRDIARGPGLTLESAVSTYRDFRNNRLEEEFSMRLTSALGNAVARSGGGGDVLRRVGNQIGQMAGKPWLSGEELTTIGEAGIPARALISDKFGTSDPTELKKLGVTSRQVLEALLEEMEKLPKVAGGIANKMENIMDGLGRAEASIGFGLFKGVAGDVESFDKSLSRLNDSGVIEMFGENIGKSFKKLGGIIGPGNMEDKAVKTMAGLDLLGEAFTWGATGLKSALLAIFPGFGTATFGVDLALAKKTGEYSRKLNEGVVHEPLILTDTGYKEGANGTETPWSKPLPAFPYPDGWEPDDPTQPWNQPWRLRPGTQYSSPIGPFSDQFPLRNQETASPTYKKLDEIAATLKSTQQLFQAFVIGGGAATNDAVNSRNLSAWSGGGGGGSVGTQIGRLIDDALGAQIVHLARNRTLSPIAH